MKKQQMLTLALVVALGLSLVLLAGIVLAQSPRTEGGTGSQAMLGTGFTYQGQLKQGGQPVSADCQMAFRLYDAAAPGGMQVGSAITHTVTVSGGLFTTQLDFGTGAFAGEMRWLGIQVQCPGDDGYADLGRQALTAAPYALYALSAPWAGISGVPADLADGDADTTYVGGTGLILSDTTFSVDTAAVQRRVSGACAVGSTIRSINVDGTVVCQSDAPLHRASPPTDNTLITLDGAGDVGRYTSITIGADGLPLISYYDVTGEDLKVAHCDDLACTSATISTLDSAGNMGSNTSVAIGADGLGLISYYDASYGDLKVAHCFDAACTSATLTTLDSVDNVGGNTAVTIGSDGLGFISYRYLTAGYLKVAHCSNMTCTDATLTTVDGSGSVGTYTSVAVGSDGLPLISYRNQGAGDLKVAHCSNVTCTAASVLTLDSGGDIGYHTSIAIGSDGLGLISYHGNSILKVAHCDNVVCSSVISTTIDGVPIVGQYTSLTIGADGLGLVAYYSANNTALKVAHCQNVACTSVTFATPDTGGTAGDVGTHVAVTIGTDGLPLISYYDITNGDLKVAHCASAFCVPYFRQR